MAWVWLSPPWGRGSVRASMMSSRVISRSVSWSFAQASRAGMIAAQ
jgi:hypothetical protein